MNDLFGPYIEKWMPLITVKRMLVVAIVSTIVTELGIRLLMLLFPNSYFYDSIMWQMLGPIDVSLEDIIIFLAGSAVSILVFSSTLYLIFKVFKGQGTFKQLVSDILLNQALNSWIHMLFLMILVPMYSVLDSPPHSGSNGLSALEWINVVVMALLMAKQFKLSPVITGIAFFLVGSIFGVLQIVLSGVL